MEPSIASHITVKMFIGYLVNAELKLQLEKSQRWKQANIIKFGNTEEIELTFYQEKSYIGRFLSKSFTTVSELEELEKLIVKRIKYFCPKYAIEKHKVTIFLQVFIS